jgi:hypothetical protein
MSQPCEEFLAGSPSLLEFGEGKLQRVNVLVKTGEQTALNIGAVLDPKSVSGMNQVHFGYIIHLSNGSAYKFARSYPVIPTEIRN